MTQPNKAQLIGNHHDVSFTEGTEMTDQPLNKENIFRHMSSIPGILTDYGYVRGDFNPILTTDENGNVLIPVLGVLGTSQEDAAAPLQDRFHKGLYGEHDQMLNILSGILTTNQHGQKPVMTHETFKPYHILHDARAVVDYTADANRQTCEIAMCYASDFTWSKISVNKVAAPSHSSNWVVSSLPSAFRVPRMIFGHENYKTSDLWFSNAQSHHSNLDVNISDVDVEIGAFISLKKVVVTDSELGSFTYYAYAFAKDGTSGEYVLPAMHIAKKVDGQLPVQDQLTNIWRLPLAAHVSVVETLGIEMYDHKTYMSDKCVVGVTVINNVLHTAQRFIHDANSAGCVRPRFAIGTWRNGVVNANFKQYRQLKNEVTIVNRKITRVSGTERPLQVVSTITSTAITGESVPDLNKKNILDKILSVESAYSLKRSAVTVKGGMDSSGKLWVDESAEGPGFCTGGEASVVYGNFLSFKLRKKKRGLNDCHVTTVPAESPNRGLDILTFTDNIPVFVKSLGHRIHLVPALREVDEWTILGYIKWDDTKWVLTRSTDDNSLPVMISFNKGRLELQGHAIYSDVLIYAALYLLSELGIAAFVDRYSFSASFTEKMLHSIGSLDPLVLSISLKTMREGLMIDISPCLFGELFRYRNVLMNRACESSLLKRGFVGQAFRYGIPFRKRNSHDKFSVGRWTLFNSAKEALISDELKVMSVNAAILDVDHDNEITINNNVQVGETVIEIPSRTINPA